MKTFQSQLATLFQADCVRDVRDLQPDDVQELLFAWCDEYRLDAIDAISRQLEDVEIAVDDPLWLGDLCIRAARRAMLLDAESRLRVMCDWADGEPELSREEMEYERN